MADAKISALPASTTPLAGTEVLPVVQSGVTKKVSVANLTAGRSVSVADLTATTGDIVIGTSGKGINFSATPGTGTSELLNDYEEGTWTPTVEGATTPGTTTYVTQSGSYTKVGRLVTCSFVVQWSASTGTGNLKIFGLPFTNATPNGDGGFFMPDGSVTVANGYIGNVNAGTTFVYTFTAISAVGGYIFGTFQYFA